MKGDAMRSTFTGLVILGVAIMIGYSSRDNTDETAAQTFGTLGLILVLCLIGLSFVRSGEAERVRNKGRSSTKKPAFKPKGPGVQPGKPFPPGAQASGGNEAAQKAGAFALVLVLLVAGGFGVKTLLIKSDLGKLAFAESASDPDEAEKKLDPLLDKTAERFALDRSEVDETVWSVWEANQALLRDYGLLPSTFIREVLAAAPKNSKLEPVASAISKEKSAARLARLHQPKPAPGKYPQEATFQKHLDQLKKKTGMSVKPITAILVSNWRTIFEKKKQNRKYSLLWWVGHVNSQTKAGTKKDAWLAKVGALTRAVK
jgi:hypothetical protein